MRAANVKYDETIRKADVNLIMMGDSECVAWMALWLPTGKRALKECIHSQLTAGEDPKRQDGEGM